MSGHRASKVRISAIWKNSDAIALRRLTDRHRNGKAPLTARITSAKAYRILIRTRPDRQLYISQQKGASILYLSHSRAASLRSKFFTSTSFIRPLFYSSRAQYPQTLSFTASNHPYQSFRASYILLTEPVPLPTIRRLH
jgi:hypothetical protein